MWWPLLVTKTLDSTPSKLGNCAGLCTQRADYQLDLKRITLAVVFKID